MDMKTSRRYLIAAASRHWSRRLNLKGVMAIKLEAAPAITVRTGVEPFRAVHARPVGLAPPQGCARLSCFRLPTRLSQEDQFSNQLPEFAYPTGDVPLLDRLPCVELPQRSPY